MNVEKPLVTAQALFNIRSFTVTWNHMNVNNVGKPSVVSETLKHTSQFMLGRNLMNVRNVEKPLDLILN